MKNRILVLGNDPQINEIDFSALDPKIITLGVNRIWLKHIPHYFFFNDYAIITELNSAPEHLAKLRSNSTIFSSDWLRPQVKKHRASIPAWTKIIDRPDPYVFPDAVTTAISIFRRNYSISSDSVFYIAGVSLLWQEPSHFWKNGNYQNSLNNHDQKWYENRFVRIEDNFKKLKALGIKMVSVNPNSRLNKMMRYESIANLYAR